MEEDIIEILIFLKKLNFYEIYYLILPEDKTYSQIKRIKKNLFQKHNFVLAVPSNTSINYLEDDLILYTTRVNHILVRIDTVCGLDITINMLDSYEVFLEKTINNIIKYINNLNKDNILVLNTKSDILLDVFTQISIYDRKNNKFIYSNELTYILRDINNYGKDIKDICIYDGRCILVDKYIKKSNTNIYTHTYKILMGFNTGNMITYSDYIYTNLEKLYNDHMQEIQFGDKLEICETENSLYPLFNSAIFSIDINIDIDIDINIDINNNTLYDYLKNNKDINVRFSDKFIALTMGSMTP